MYSTGYIVSCSYVFQDPIEAVQQNSITKHERSKWTDKGLEQGNVSSGFSHIPTKLPMIVSMLAGTRYTTTDRMAISGSLAEPQLYKTVEHHTKELRS